jgi:adenosylmethionine-8-amino-7-oxononanoate aminotransferase
MSLSEKSRALIWHPFTQMQVSAAPAGIVKGKASKLWDENGKVYVDAISSWWVNIHGHAHPHIAKKISAQLNTLEHCIFADFTHAPAVELAERLLPRLPGQDRIFFSDNGSTAVEVALKMVMQYWHNLGEKRNTILALENAYHGDTFGAMSAAERSPFNLPFQPYLFDVTHLPSPENGGLFLDRLRTLLQQGNVAGFIFEPLVQGSGGMKMYSPETLDKALSLCREHGVPAIADEVMTGFGRTGKWMATSWCSNEPDIVCLSKGLTGGTLPMGITSCKKHIFEAFLSSDRLKTFFHGHSFTGNPVGCAAALASLDLMEKPETWEQIGRIEQSHLRFAEKLAEHPLAEQVRTKGTILAFDVKTGEKSGYFNPVRELLYPYFLERGVLLRPLGNVVYILPPYCMTEEELQQVYGVISDGLDFLQSRKKLK